MVTTVHLDMMQFVYIVLSEIVVRCVVLCCVVLWLM